MEGLVPWRESLTLAAGFRPPRRGGFGDDGNFGPRAERRDAVRRIPDRSIRAGFPTRRGAVRAAFDRVCIHSHLLPRQGPTKSGVTANGSGAREGVRPTNRDPQSEDRGPEQREFLPNDRRAFRRPGARRQATGASKTRPTRASERDRGAPRGILCGPDPDTLDRLLRFALGEAAGDEAGHADDGIREGEGVWGGPEPRATTPEPNHDAAHERAPSPPGGRDPSVAPTQLRTHASPERSSGDRTTHDHGVDRRVAIGRAPVESTRHDASTWPFLVYTGLIVGVEAIRVGIEATLKGDSGAGGPRVLGQVEGGIREACIRVLNAFAAQGLPTPRAAPLLNFSPAGLRKVGAHFDLPMALALAGAGGLLDRERLERIAAFGELTMRGSVRAAGGAFVLARCAAEAGLDTILCAPEEAPWAALVREVRAIPVRDLATAIAFLRGAVHIEPSAPHTATRSTRPPLELADLRGLRTAKRALVVAAAGRHDLLMVGPPGCGKTALARRLADLLPPPTEDEAGAILAVRDAAAALAVGPSVAGAAAVDVRLERPFRAPHHTSSSASLLGGGQEPRPGEITLAHHGVLFLDELTEFRRATLEGLRQPLEERRVTIGRARATVVLPADFVLVGAMNPCPCGMHGHPERPCVCGPLARERYVRRLSGPLLDRFDLRLTVPALRIDEMESPKEEPTTATARAMVDAAWRRQLQRGRANARLSDRELEACTLDAAPDSVRSTLREVLRRRRASGRARVRLLRVARTIADLDDREGLVDADVWEADRLRGVAPGSR
jgi:magnesium chelatase family protein